MEKRKRNTPTTKMNSESLPVKYRPKTLDDLVGQGSVVAQVKGFLKTNNIPSAILIEGPTGTGKTTLARIIANMVSTPANHNGKNLDINEVNAGTDGKIDNIRHLVRTAGNSPLLGRKRIIIIDECVEGQTPIVINTNGDTKTAKEIYEDFDNIAIEGVLSQKDDGTDEIKPLEGKFKKTIEASKLIKIGIGDKALTVTEDHLLWSVCRNDWVKASDIQVGEELSCPKGKTVYVELVTRLETYTPTEVYDFRVKDNHNFYAGQEPVLNHNCHLLTGASASALLVPIEEPPADTMWILATTNPERMLPTMLGRCLRLSLSPVDKVDMRKRLLTIAKKEGHNIRSIDGGKEALNMICDFSNGYMRNAVSLLESVLYGVNSGEDFSTESVLNKFVTTGDIDIDVKAQALVLAALDKNLKACLKTLYDVNNARAMTNKITFLLDCIIKSQVAHMKFRPYVYQLYKKNSAKFKEPSLRDLVCLQAAMTQASISFNQTAVKEESVLQMQLINYFEDTRNAG